MTETTTDAATGVTHGAAPLPAEPTHRSITPAPEDYAVPTPTSRLLWPLFWFAVATGVVLLVLAAGWHPFDPAH